MKRKELTKKAILISKHINNKKTDSDSIRSMFRMRYALQSNKPVKSRHYLEFMTEKGRMKFLVDPRHYNSIKIDSLGDLTYERGNFISFHFQKIATKKDVEKLGW